MNQPQTTPEPSDEALLQRFAAGDDRCFALVYERWSGPAVGYAARMLRNTHEAEEIVADVFVQVARGRWRPEGRFKPWLFTVVHRRCVDRIRRRRRWEGVRHLLRGPAAAESPDAGLHQRDTHARLEEALAQLPDEHRAAVLLFHHHDLPSKEVAAALDRTDQQVRSMLAYGRRRLRDLLEEAP